MTPPNVGTGAKCELLLSGASLKFNFMAIDLIFGISKNDIAKTPKRQQTKYMRWCKPTSWINLSNILFFFNQNDLKKLF